MTERLEFATAGGIMQIERFIGGVLDTNGYLIRSGERAVMIDAPQGTAAWLAEKSVTLEALWLTHTHFDHILDAAAVQRDQGCPLICHPSGEAMLKDPGMLRRFGFNLEFEPATPDRLIDETSELALGQLHFRIFHVPGHSPDSICFYEASSANLFGGDVLFSGGVGRSDLPGGNGPQLFAGIREKLYPLPDEVRVWPGHGPSTTIGTERTHNPFVRS